MGGPHPSVEGLDRTKSQSLPSKREFFLPDCLPIWGITLLLLEQPASLWTETRALALQIWTYQPPQSSEPVPVTSIGIDISIHLWTHFSEEPLTHIPSDTLSQKSWSITSGSLGRRTRWGWSSRMGLTTAPGGGGGGPAPAGYRLPAEPAMGRSQQTQTGLQVYPGGVGCPGCPSAPLGPRTHQPGSLSVSGTCPRRRC